MEAEFTMAYLLDIQTFSVNILSSNFQLYKQVTTLSNQGHGYSIYSLAPISFSHGQRYPRNKHVPLWAYNGGKGEIRTLGARRHGGLANHCTRPTMRPFHVEPPIGLEPTTS